MPPGGRGRRVGARPGKSAEHAGPRRASPGRRGPEGAVGAVGAAGAARAARAAEREEEERPGRWFWWLLANRGKKGEDEAHRGDKRHRHGILSVGFFGGLAGPALNGDSADFGDSVKTENI
ncbi:hypothetical protein KM043_012338 [Ampulex compressa]|nr:hypothetical protein KM043_012338 [Ampulex compressa]